MAARPVRYSDIAPGRYICLKTKSPLGAVVRLFCHPSPFDHVVVATGNGRCVQATVRGVKESLLTDFWGCEAVVCTDLMSAAQGEAIAAKARTYVGDEYGWQYLPLIALRKAGLRSEWAVRVCQDSDAVICSELAVLAGKAGGMDWLCGGETDAAMVRPDELANRPTVAPVAWV